MKIEEEIQSTKFEDNFQKAVINLVAETEFCQEMKNLKSERDMSENCIPLKMFQIF